MPVMYVLPMPSELYERDFDGASLGEYRELLSSSNVLTLPLSATARQTTYTLRARARSAVCAARCFIAAHCHILLALWDGNEKAPSGGTAAIIRYHQDDFMLGLTDGEPRSRLDDTDDESDLVYHIVCSRDRPDGAPTPPLRRRRGVVAVAQRRRRREPRTCRRATKSCCGAWSSSVRM